MNFPGLRSSSRVSEAHRCASGSRYLTSSNPTRLTGVRTDATPTPLMVCVSPVNDRTRVLENSESELINGLARPIPFLRVIASIRTGSWEPISSRNPAHCIPISGSVRLSISRTKMRSPCTLSADGGRVVPPGIKVIRESTTLSSSRSKPPISRPIFGRRSLSKSERPPKSSFEPNGIFGNYGIIRI